MKREDLIARIIERAKNVVPMGYATFEEMTALAVPNGSVAEDLRYKLGTRTVTSEESIVGSIRSVEWIGEIEGLPQGELGNRIEGTRHWVAQLVEIIVNGAVVFSIPFPATGIQSKGHDEMMWQFSMDVLKQCNNLQLRLIAEAVRAW